MPTNTLTSLAILRVNRSNSTDYLDYLRPFVLHILSENKIESITDDEVKKCILEKFGLEIPHATIAIVLKRLSKKRYLKRERGSYWIIGDLPDTQIITEQAKAARKINAILAGLQQFSQETTNPINDNERAIIAICAFLSEFDISFLRSYLQGTALPQINTAHSKDVVLVAQYVQHIEKFSPDLFDSFFILVQGHMLANALTCPDLHSISPTYRGVTFYLDTQLLIHILELGGRANEVSSRELIDLLIDLGGKVRTFSHSFQELKRILQTIADKLDPTKTYLQDGYGTIFYEAKKNNLSSSDIFIIIESLEEKLNEKRIIVERTPPSNKIFQIDESAFGRILNHHVNYFNRHMNNENSLAKDHDIKCVRSIYAIRQDKLSLSIEKTNSIFVTNNSNFAKAAGEYVPEHSSREEISSVITATSLANIAWLKTPMKSQSIPKAQLFAVAYAALKPSDVLLKKYLMEIDEIKSKGKITQRAHQLLRSSYRAIDEVMNLTLGEQDMLNEETVMQINNRLTSEIKKEESDKLAQEKKHHERTRNSLSSAQSINKKLMKNIRRKCDIKSTLIAWICSILISIPLLISVFITAFYKIELNSLTPRLFWALIVCIAISSVIYFINTKIGNCVKKMHRKIKHKCRVFFINRECKFIGIDPNEVDNISK